MLSALAKEHAANDRDAACILHASHCLAQVYMCKRNFDAAQDYCQKAIVGRRRILGKQHPDYYGSLNLLAYIYKAKDFDARKALLWAAEEEHDAAVRLLLERGTNIDEIDE